MRALSLWRPWAQAVAEGVKRVETRSWATEYRGLVAICSTAGPAKKVDVPLTESLGTRQGRAGHVLGVVHLVAVVPTDDVDVDDLERAWGDYTPGRFAWLLDDARPLHDPIPVKGRRLLWTLDPSTSRRVHRQLSSSP